MFISFITLNSNDNYYSVKYLKKTFQSLNLKKLIILIHFIYRLSNKIQVNFDKCI
jgi:hypothetical protein